MFSTLALLLAPSILPQEAPDPARVAPQRMRSTLRALCRKSRLAGSPEAKAAADYVSIVLEGAGWRVERPKYRSYLPRQIGQSLELWHADGRRESLELNELGFAEDPDSKLGVAPMHGLTASGRVSGKVVFAGHGTEEEFTQLRQRLGSELNGRIALIRYGGFYRGLKVKNAADFGCAGALLYTDPEDDGGKRGPVMPGGPWRPSDGIQRGSVFNRDGDPLTPGWPAVEEATRVPIESAHGLVSIPSLPISWGNARKLFGGGRRPNAPQALESFVQFEVQQDPSLVPIENVIGFLEGSERPHEWVIFGGHRDAWGLGATDNGTGITVLLEMARVLGDAYRRGWRPQRTIVIATWDAEEWGLVGSTEWVEQNQNALRVRGVAYVNLDAVATGPHFNASCTPGVVKLLQRVCAAEGVEVPDNVGNPGGGSDHVPFLELAGMEVLNYGFGGGHGGYHSAYDTPELVERHLDPDFAHHARAARLGIRLASALTRLEAGLDGLQGWTQSISTAIDGLELTSEQREPLGKAVAELKLAVGRRASTGNDHPYRFLRYFLPPEQGARLLLWQTAGYGGQWFPEIHTALAEERSPKLEIERAAHALRLAARVIAGGPERAGR